MSKVKITYLEALNALAALNRLDGYKDGDQTKPYRFAPQALISIAKGIRSLKGVAEDYETARVALAKQFNPQPKEGDESYPLFVEAINKLLSEEVEIEVSRVKLSSLKLDDNPVPPGLLAQIFPLVEEDQ